MNRRERTIATLFLCLSAILLPDPAKASANHTQSEAVSCKIEDNLENNIDRVQFPMWTLKDGQDDLAENWQTNPGSKGEGLPDVEMPDDDIPPVVLSREITKKDADTIHVKVTAKDNTELAEMTVRGEYKEFISGGMPQKVNPVNGV